MIISNAIALLLLTFLKYLFYDYGITVFVKSVNKEDFFYVSTDRTATDK